VDFQDRTPIYEQLVNQVKELINRGHLPLGHRLPSVRQLAQDLGVNLNTVARAYRELGDLGLLEVRQGRPVIVVSARRPCDAEELDNLRKLAGQLVNEAMLLGLGGKQLHALVDSELAARKGKRSQ
jgi:GntR family transcriptional regulator